MNLSVWLRFASVNVNFCTIRRSQPKQVFLCGFDCASQSDDSDRLAIVDFEATAAVDIKLSSDHFRLGTFTTGATGAVHLSTKTNSACRVVGRLESASLLLKFPMDFIQSVNLLYPTPPAILLNRAALPNMEESCLLPESIASLPLTARD